MFGVRYRHLFVLAVMASLSLTGCSQTQQEASEETSVAAGTEESSGQWPRTIDVGDTEVTLEQQPQRVVALSTETGDLALELVGPERVTAVSDGSVQEGSGNQVEFAQQVEYVFESASAPAPDPERILALDPDLVLLTDRHDGEGSAADMLESAGVPTVSFAATDFASPEAVANNVSLLGELLGAEDEATQIATELIEQVNAVESALTDTQERPTTIVLMARGGQQMIMGAESATTKLVETAGGEALATTRGWDAAIPADPETIIAANPEVILVQDFQESGLGPFQGLLEDTALQEVPAVLEDRVHVVDARTTSGTAGSTIGEGLEQVAELLHPEAF